MSGKGYAAGDESVVRTLRIARVISGGLLVGVLVATFVAHVVVPDRRVNVLVLPAALAGLVAPVIGYRLYHGLRGRVSPRSRVATRLEVFVRATVSALAVTEAAALFGAAAYWAGRDWAALTGVATHLLLTGAVWPSGIRLEVFLESGLRS